MLRRARFVLSWKYYLLLEFYVIKCRSYCLFNLLHSHFVSIVLFDSFVYVAYFYALVPDLFCHAYGQTISINSLGVYFLFSVILFSVQTIGIPVLMDNSCKRNSYAKPCVPIQVFQPQELSLQVCFLPSVISNPSFYACRPPRKEQNSVWRKHQPYFP